MKNEAKSIELTEEEKATIIAERKRKQKEDELKKAQEDEARANLKVKMATKMADTAKDLKAGLNLLRNAYAELKTKDSRYEWVADSKNVNLVVRDRITGVEVDAIASSAWGKIVYKPEHPELLRGEGIVTISADHYETYSGTGFFANRRDQGWRLFIHGLDWDLERRAYKSVVTIHKRISEDLRHRKASADRKVAKKNLMDRALADLQERYPKAEVAKDTKGYRVGNGPRGWRSYEVLTVKLPNINITLSVREGEKGLQYSYEGMSYSGNPLNLVDALSILGS